MKKTVIAVLVLSAVSAPSFVSAHEATVCTAQYQPVCGTEKGTYKTYGNGCTLAAEDAVYQHEGECTSSELKGLSGGKEYVPPAHCVAWNDGCNSCSRQGNGMAACTLMACMGEPRAGYCTAYADAGEEQDTPKSTPGSSVSPGVAAGEVSGDVGMMASVTATTTDATPGFFARIWGSISGWFKNLF